MENVDLPVQGDEQDALSSIDLRRYLLALRKYAWLVAALVVLGITAAVIYTTRQTPIYEATASVEISPRLPDLLGTGDLFNVAAGGGNANEYYDEQRNKLGSYSLVQKTIEQNDLIPSLLSESERKDRSLTDQLDIATRLLQKNLKITYPKKDHVMYISVRNPTPALAQSIANLHAKTYENYTKGLLLLNSSTASDALQLQFDEAEKELRTKDAEIYAFQQKNDMIAMTLEQQQGLVSSNIMSFTEKLNDARASRIALNAKLQQIRKESKEEVLSTPIVMLGDNPSFQTLRAEYYSEKIHLLELEKDLGPKNPDYLAQKQKVDELFKALEGEVKIVVNGTTDLHEAATMTETGLQAELDKAKDEAKRLSPVIGEYTRLIADRKVIQDRYDILRSRLSTTQLTGSMSSALSNVRQHDPALLPTSPVSPNMRINVMIAGMLSLLLGIGIVVLIVFLDRSVKNTVDASQCAGAAVLGIIPMLSEEVNANDDRARDMFVHEHPTSRVAECCRSLRTNVLFSAADRQLKTLLVCSANPREGKTMNVIYLGTTMAQSGQRVLLIDTDMRRPRLHASTGVTRQQGLSNLILGDDNYDEVVKKTEIPNLFVLPCGPLPPNPAELIMTKRFEHVLAELGNRFDRIILDSPPLQAVTDAVVLSRRVDGVIMVVRAGKTMREEVKRSVRQIRDVGGSIMGCIVNEIDTTDRAGGYYYYSYYGYGEKEREQQGAA